MRLKREKSSGPDKSKGWTLDTGINSSLLNEWLACREKARLSYVERLAPMQGRREAMHLGTFIHRVLELSSGALKGPKGVDVVIDTVLDEWRKAEGPAASEDKEQLMENTAAKAAVIVPLYLDFWKEKDEGKEWISRERTFAVEWRGFKLVGQMDGLFRDKSGGIWVLETKTRSRVNEGELSRALSFDLQTSFYQLCALQFLSRKDRARFRGTVYNVIKTPQIKQKKKETHEQFYARMKETIKGDLSGYFIRIENATLADDIEAWGERILDPILENVKDWAFDVTHKAPKIEEPPFNGKLIEYVSYLNPQACYDRYGLCKFYRLCAYGDKNSYRRKEKPFEHYSKEPEFFDV